MTDVPYRILAFDTSAAALSLALADGAAVVAARHEAMERGQAEALIPAIDALLAEHGWAYETLSAIAVTIGPGAFTGLRIGLAAARALALALGIPAIGATTLEVMAREPRVAASGRAAIVALDSKRGDWYWQAFGAEGGPLGTPNIAGGDTLVARAGELGARIYADRPDLLPAGGSVADHEPLHPHASVLASLIAAEAGAAHRLEPPFCPPEPLYLRGAEARPAKGRQ